MQIADNISFGAYDWRVLAIQDNTALIITEKIIEQRSYHNKYIDITWADCSLREYLNTEFYDRFSEAEKSKIIPALNKRYYTTGQSPAPAISNLRFDAAFRG